MDKVFWLWFPLASFVLFCIAEVVLPAAQYQFYVGENGPLEYLQVFVLLGAIILAFKGFKAALSHPQILFRIVCGLGALGCIYIAGEEVSWGQQIFKWATPDSWMAVNDQQETNLHNTSSWFDQKPRLILEIGVIIGGLLLPAIMKYKPAVIPSWLKDIAPPAKMAVLATCFLIVKLCVSADKFSDLVIFKRGSELIELYIYYFMALYLFYLLGRIKGTLDKSA